MADAVRAEGLDTQLLSYVFDQLRSDYVNLVGAGIPTVFFTDANDGCYHTVHDDVQHLDWKKLRRQTHIAFRTVLALTEAHTPPRFAGVSPALATFTDLQRVAAVVAAARTDLALFAEPDRPTVERLAVTLQAMVADGAPRSTAAASPRCSPARSTW